MVALHTPYLTWRLSTKASLAQPITGRVVTTGLVPPSQCICLCR